MTLDADVEAKLRAAMRERGISFKVAINDAVRSGLGGSTPSARRYRMPTAPLGARAGIDLDRALTLVGELEDAETLRKLELGK